MTTERIAELEKLCQEYSSEDADFASQSRQALPECLEEIKRLRSALKSISNFIRCDGPQCYDCGNDYEHPLSHEAEIAKKALEK